MSTPTNTNIDTQLEYTYKEITLDASSTINDYRLKIFGRELYYSAGDIDLTVAFNDKSRGDLTIQPLRRITFAENKGFNELIINSSTTTSTTTKLIVTSGDLIVQDYTAEVTGTISQDITKIGGSTTPVTNWSGILKGDNPDETRLIKATFQNTGSADLYTVPAGKVAYIHSITLNTFGLANVDSQTFVKVAGNNIMIQLVHVDNESITNTLAPQIPIKMIATEVLNLTGATNSWSSCSVYLTEVTA
jgi:hypothetical protein